METSFLSGSENLYKYLVSIGLLLIVLTVFYPLKEKQDLEVSRISIEKEALILNYQIKETSKDVEILKSKVKSLTDKELIENKLNDIDNLIKQSQISQFELEQKYEEINTRKKHISLYNVLFWIFFPIGVVITFFGFYKWLKSKTVDDGILELEKKKLELEIDKLEAENNADRTTLYKRNVGESDKTNDTTDNQD